ncbi:hypothetical protein LEM8419_00200 [Neolewinella maritima]|uniref:Type II toxin-antitoxin system HigB family toxin n=1 Tax=Neolewinella maritima TaxID=1383882 RepID=A0ABM9AWV4_9BACT|nr:type II toxin-antitoxin system HigB family toxin [Neolewinella maritima]CAH0998887.1 hypothetical protein LEM8419_00200 [Neolewinella maritima]
MRIIAKRTLREYWSAEPAAEQALKDWYQRVKAANWATPNDVKSFQASASLVGDNRVVFNIKGNTYRLIVRINYERATVFIKFIGTHREYDNIDATKV